MDPEEMQIGTRVQVKEPDPGQPFHTANRSVYTNECWPGRRGTIKRLPEYSSGTVGVRWDEGASHPPPTGWSEWGGGNSSSIDPRCLEPEGAPEVEEELLQEYMTLLAGRTTHCPTCTCGEK